MDDDGHLTHGLGNDELGELFTLLEAQERKFGRSSTEKKAVNALRDEPPDEVSLDVKINFFLSIIGGMESWDDSFDDPMHVCKS